MSMQTGWLGRQDSNLGSRDQSPFHPLSPETRCDGYCLRIVAFSMNCCFHSVATCCIVLRKYGTYVVAIHLTRVHLHELETI